MNSHAYCDFDPCTIGTGITSEDHVAIILMIKENDGTQRVEYLYDPSLPLPSFSASQAFF